MARTKSKRASGRSWKLERASVNKRGAAKSRSNKYSHNDAKPRPPVGSRSRVWVGGYDRADGTHVDGYYRRVAR